MIIRKPADQYSDDHLGWGEASVHVSLVHLRVVDGPLKVSIQHQSIKLSHFILKSTDLSCDRGKRR